MLDKISEIKKYYSRYSDIVDDYDEFINSLFRPLPHCIWTNTSRITPERLRDMFVKDGLDPETLPWDDSVFKFHSNPLPGSRWWYKAGLCHSQEEVSLLPVKIMNPEPGDRILDLCSAPGGKTARISIALNGTGTVIANDINSKRINLVRYLIKKLGLINVSTTVLDGGNFPAKAGLFDKVLVDVPCSCEGTIRKNNKIIAKIIKGRDSYSISRQQKAILRAGIRLCKPGGIIVYSTCTFAPEENEMVINSLLDPKEEERFEILKFKIENFKTSSGIIKWKDENFHPDLKYTQRIWPHHNDTGGFYIAVLKKISTDKIKKKIDLHPVKEIPAPEIEEHIIKRFKLPEDIFRNGKFTLRTNSGLYFVNKGHLPPLRPEAITSGLVFVKHGIKPPKLSTTASMIIGNMAEKNIIQLTEGERDDYLSRKDFQISQERLKDCSTGYVIVKYDNFPIGLGRLHAETGKFWSLFPKGWVNE